MPVLDAQLRCWNHESREAVCRCMACGRSYCRECVAEHRGRWLCAACLTGAVAAQAARRGILRRLATPAMIAAGLLLAWLAYWLMGESVIGLIRRIEQTPHA